METELRDALFSAAQSVALPPRREVPSLIPGANSHPADIYLPCAKRGKPAALDVSAISPLQKLTVEGDTSTQGHALQVGKTKSELLTAMVALGWDPIFLAGGRVARQVEL